METTLRSTIKNMKKCPMERINNGGATVQEVNFKGSGYGVEWWCKHRPYLEYHALYPSLNIAATRTSIFNNTSIITESRAMEENMDTRNNDGQISPAYSFEVLDPHDPVISRLATQLFYKTNEYLQGEMTAGQEHYALLEEINRQGITKFADLRNFVSNLFKTLYDYERICDQQIKPLLEQIDLIEAQMTLVEQKAYQLDAYTKQLYNLHKEMLEK